MMKKKIKITLVKSLIGRLPKHKLIAEQLGLTKMHRTVEHSDNPSIRGMISKIDYMVSVEESA
jgi:large subunit ribosomal protein L30